MVEYHRYARARANQERGRDLVDNLLGADLKGAAEVAAAAVVQYLRKGGMVLDSTWWRKSRAVNMIRARPPGPEILERAVAPGGA